MQRSELQAQMDACRSRRRDLDEPELADLREQLAADPALQAQFESLQKIDDGIGRAFTSVPVPAGLEERLLQNLRIDPAVAADTDDVEEPLATASRSTRRVWLAGSLVATAAAVLVAAWALWGNETNVLPSNVEEEAIFYHRDFAHSDLPLRSMNDDPEMRLAAEVNFRAVAGWQLANGFLNSKRRAVAFQLSVNGQPATLYAIAGQSAGLPTRPGRMIKTAGYAATAWQSEDMVYVLVLPKGGQPRDFLNLGNGLASICRPQLPVC